ncbi:hypothetical protein SCUCBS95973_003262 [Sporothrix curviconia]|uniref:C2H2-type domain-containing protein n=1 Tax=Sporothrix curviconia TaxID=1260050 RepID=A0ABP0BE31_9PEZI
MKRKATEELVADRPGPSHDLAARGKGSAPLERLHHVEEPEASTADDDLNSLDGHTAPSEAHTTPVTTALSTASRRFPSDLKTIPCTWPDCTKTFNRPARLTAHLRSHTNDRPFKCPDCPKTYLEEKHLRQHIKGSHSQERQYVCTECSKAFLTATRLRRHAAVHEGQDRFRCRGYDENCTRSFRKHQTLQRHIRVDHLNQPAFACTHKISASGAASRTMCEAVFDSQGALRRHVERDHTAPKFWCEECCKAGGHAAGFATRALLETHMRHEHVDCPFCEARCAGPAELHRHIDMHHSGKSVADRKNIVCPHDGCGKSFTRRANLNVHIRAAHEGLRFVCGDADAASVTTAGGAGEGVERAFPRSATDPELAAWEARGEGCGRGFVSKMKLEEHILYVHLRRERPAPATAPVVVFDTVAPIAATASAAGFLLPGGEDSLAAAASSTDTMIDALLGANRTLACSVPGCDARFVRNHDLNVHLERDHPVPGTSMGYHDMETDANDTNDQNENMFNPNEFWIGGGDNMDSGDTTSVAVAAAMAADDDMFGAYVDMGNMGNMGDMGMGLPVSGLGSLPQQLVNGHMMDNGAQWRMDEAEMRQLIGSDAPSNTDNGTFLDPDLFF